MRWDQIYSFMISTSIGRRRSMNPSPIVLRPVTDTGQRHGPVGNVKTEDSSGGAAKFQIKARIPPDVENIHAVSIASATSEPQDHRWWLQATIRNSNGFEGGA
jgi:hypothetical protein